MNAGGNDELQAHFSDWQGPKLFYKKKSKRYIMDLPFFYFLKNEYKGLTLRDAEDRAKWRRKRKKGDPGLRRGCFERNRDLTLT